jgi:hypothetical protein
MVAPTWSRPSWLPPAPAAGSGGPCCRRGRRPRYPEHPVTSIQSKPYKAELAHDQENRWQMTIQFCRTSCLDCIRLIVYVTPELYGTDTSPPSEQRRLRAIPRWTSTRAATFDNDKIYRMIRQNDRNNLFFKHLTMFSNNVTHATAKMQITCKKSEFPSGGPKLAGFSGNDFGHL